MFNRSCTSKYNDTYSRQKFDSIESINKYLVLDNDPPCFEILPYTTFLKQIGKNYDAKKHSVDICRTSGTNSKASTANYIATHIEEHQEGNEMHGEPPSPVIVLVKNSSKGGRVVIAMALYEISLLEQQLSIHYICKCSNQTLSGSCIDMPRVSALMIYYLAFLAKKNKLKDVYITADSHGGESLVNYYKSLGFKSYGIIENDTPMQMSLEGDLSFPRAVSGGSQQKDRSVLYKNRTYLVKKQGRLNYIRVGKSKSIVYLKDVVGEYKWTT